jgi:hypothetical protein
LADLPLILFPHSQITYEALERILALFDQLIIYQPWFMDGPPKPAEAKRASLVHVCRPPEYLKPKGNFRVLLSEYYQWIRYNRDKGYTFFLQSAHKMALSEESQWEIGAEIRRQAEDTSSKLEDHVLKWHLILHLAQEIEQSRREGKEILMQMRCKTHPLQEVLGGEAPSQGMLEDLPQADMSLFIDAHHLRLVLEAWFGLFAQLLPDRGVFLTLDRLVINYVTEMFEEKVDQLSKDAAASILPEAVSSKADLTFHQIHSLADAVNSHPDFVLKGLSDKTIILLSNDSYA